MSKTPFSLRLIDSRTIAPDVKHLAFEPSIALDFIPGQFVRLHLEHNNTPLLRSYSIATRTDHTSHIEMAVSYVPHGPASDYLFALTPGDTLSATGPFGRLILGDEHPKRYILVATGTGVTPYRAMLPALKTLLDTTDLTVELLLGVRTPDHLLYGQEFIEFDHTHPRFHFHAYYSRYTPDHAAPYAHAGYVQTGFDTLDLDPTNDLVYLCGNPDMIDTAFVRLQDHAFSTRQIRREKYISGK